MPNSYNSVTLIGHLGQDPEIVPNGPTRFSIAVNDRWKDANGEKQERVNWFNVIAWNGVSDAAQKLAKGDPVFVTGTLRENTWEEEGKKRSRVEIVAQNIIFLKPKKK